MNLTKKPTLVILAAGMGSRYGGLKQMDTFTKEGDTIIDFSLYDAIKAGFGKVIFIIRKQFETSFKSVFNKKLAGKIEVEYAYQGIDISIQKHIHKDRVKPLGTGHALLMVQHIVKENFAIINADDFYGREAFFTMATYLKNTDKNSFHFSMMAYALKNTISENGAVSRGECSVDADNYLIDIVERENIEKLNGELVYREANNKIISIDKNTVVSMNFWGFTPKCFAYVEELFLQFLKENKQQLTAEFYLPSIVKKFITTKKGTVKVLNSNAQWFGVTYSKDKEKVQKEIEKLKEKNIYPTELWQ